MEKNKKWMIIFLAILLLSGIILVYLYNFGPPDFVWPNHDYGTMPPPPDIGNYVFFLGVGSLLLFFYFLLNIGKIAWYKIFLKWIIVNLLFFVFSWLEFAYIDSGESMALYAFLAYIAIMAVITAVISLIVYLIKTRGKKQENLIKSTEIHEPKPKSQKSKLKNLIIIVAVFILIIGCLGIRRTMILRAGNCEQNYTHYYIEPFILNFLSSLQETPYRANQLAPHNARIRVIQCLCENIELNRNMIVEYYNNELIAKEEIFWHEESDVSKDAEFICEYETYEIMDFDPSNF